MTKFEVGQVLICKNNDCLKGNDYAPDLKVGNRYQIAKIILDSKGNQHLDVGLKSNLNFVRSFETKEKLPEGETIHWCHPSRFELLNN